MGMTKFPTYEQGQQEQGQGCIRYNCGLDLRILCAEGEILKIRQTVHGFKISCSLLNIVKIPELLRRKPMKPMKSFTSKFINSLDFINQTQSNLNQLKFPLM